MDNRIELMTLLLRRRESVMADLADGFIDAEGAATLANAIDTLLFNPGQEAGSLYGTTWALVNEWVKESLPKRFKDCQGQHGGLLVTMTAWSPTAFGVIATYAGITYTFELTTRADGTYTLGWSPREAE